MTFGPHPFGRLRLFPCFLVAESRQSTAMNVSSTCGMCGRVVMVPVTYFNNRSVAYHSSVGERCEGVVGWTLEEAAARLEELRRRIDDVRETIG